jgi:hypothetical protein
MTLSCRAFVVESLPYYNVPVPLGITGSVWQQYGLPVAAWMIACLIRRKSVPCAADVFVAYGTLKWRADRHLNRLCVVLKLFMCAGFCCSQ